MLGMQRARAAQLLSQLMLLLWDIRIVLSFRTHLGPFHAMNLDFGSIVDSCLDRGTKILVVLGHL